MKLICVKNEMQLDSLINNKEIKRENTVFIPLMPKAALGMLDSGMANVRLPIEFLSKEEREAIYGEAIDLSKSWYQRANLKVEYAGIDLLDCCRLQMIGFFQDVLVAERIAPRLVAEYRPKEVSFFKHPYVPSVGHSMHDGTADVFEAVLQWRFQQMGIKVAVPPMDPKKSVKYLVKEILRVYFQKFKQVVNFFKNQSISLRTEKQDSGRIMLSDLPKDKPLLIGLGSGYDLLVIWPYLKAIAQEIGGFPVLLNNEWNFNPSTFRSGLMMDADFRYLFTGDIPLAPTCISNLKLLRSQCLAALENGETLPHHLQNPLLDFQFKLLWDSLVPVALKAARQATFFYANYNAALYLDDYCAGVENRAWTEAGNLGNVVTVNVSHGGINLLEFFDFNSQWMFTRGELDRKQLVMAFPERNEHIAIIGDPAMENIRTSLVNDTQIKRNKVLFLTGGFLHQAWTDMDLQGFISTWQEIARMAHERPSLEFIVKPHPSVRDLGEWYQGFIREKSISNVKVIGNQKLEDLLPSAFLAFLVGKPGTAGLVTALAGVPFVFLDTMLCRNVMGYSLWRDGNGVPKLTSPPQLVSVIDQVYESEIERNRLLEQNRVFLSLYLSPFQPGKICKQIGLKGRD